MFRPNSAAELMQCFNFETSEFDLSRLPRIQAEADAAKLMLPPAVIAKPYKPRQRSVVKDPRTCAWYVDYVINADGTWNNPSHRNFIKFRNRFVISRDGVMELTNTIRNLDADKGKFWPDDQPRSRPLELLVLGSLRMMSRCWTLDDVHEATFISTTTMHSFFKKFVHWLVRLTCDSVLRFYLFDI